MQIIQRLKWRNQNLQSFGTKTNEFTKEKRHFDSFMFRRTDNIGINLFILCLNIKNIYVGHLKRSRQSVL